MSAAASPQYAPAGGSVPKDRFSTHPWTAPIPPEWVAPPPSQDRFSTHPWTAPIPPPPAAAAAAPPPPTLLPRAAAPAPVAPPPQLLPPPRHPLDVPFPPAPLPTSMAVVPAPAPAIVDPRQARAADLEPEITPEMHRVEARLEPPLPRPANDQFASKAADMPATRAAAATAALAATSALAAVRGAVHDATEAAPAPPPTCLAPVQTGPAEAIEDPGCGARRLSHEGCAAFRPRYAAPPPPLPPASPPVAQPQLAASMYAAAANYSAAAAVAAAAAVDRTDAKCLLPSPGELARAAWGPRTACCVGNVSRDDGHDGASPAAAAAAAARTAAAAAAAIAAATDGSITGGDGEEEDELQPLGSHYYFPASRTQRARDSLETQPSTPIRQGQDRRCMSSITQPWL